MHSYSCRPFGTSELLPRSYGNYEVSRTWCVSFYHFFWVLSFLVAQFLPDINNEKIHKFNATYRNNFASLDSLILVKAKRDTQVFPSESEWFGVYADVDAFKRILKYNETTWYQQDLFGLKELDRAGKIHFYETDGDHLVISDQTIIQLVRKHFRVSPYFQSDSASAA